MPDDLSPVLFGASGKLVREPAETLPRTERANLCNDARSFPLSSRLTLWPSAEGIIDWAIWAVWRHVLSFFCYKFERGKQMSPVRRKSRLLFRRKPSMSEPAAVVHRISPRASLATRRVDAITNAAGPKLVKLPTGEVYQKTGVALKRQPRTLAPMGVHRQDRRESGGKWDCLNICTYIIYDFAIDFPGVCAPNLPKEKDYPTEHDMDSAATRD